jgi:hypothetical protein
LPNVSFQKQILAARLGVISMSIKYVSSVCLLFGFAGAMGAQTAPATPAATAPATPVARPASNMIAGIPVNYDEAKVGTYTLADPLKLDNGKQVKDAKTWMKERRPEILKIFETQQYGVMPGRPADESFEVTDKGTPALGGKAIRKQVTIHLSKDPTWPAIHLVEYLPANAKKPVPMYFDINFGAVQAAVDDPGITPQKVRDGKTNELVAPPPPGGRGFGKINAEIFLDAGIGVATFNYAELDPDTLTGFTHGIRAKYLKPGQTDRAPEDWGSISAWAWGMSRVEDYFETDKQVDAKRVAIHGVSRLGKTVTWAGAYDQRFGAVIASCGGEGGAALSHRDYGETIAHLTEKTRYPYQFAANYAKYGGFPDSAPFDAHMLVALIAPRPVLLQTGSTDTWSDPKGEFLAAVAAGPVYKLLGKQDLGTDVWPAAKTPLFSNGLNYYMHDGGHGMVPTDYDIYVQFLKAQFHPEQ